MPKKKTRFKVKEHQLYTVKPAVWRKLKKQNSVHKAYRFRARKIELIHRFFVPAAWIQWSIYKNRLRKISFKDEAPLFIIGLWRSGTTHLHYAMVRDAQFAYLNNHQAFTFNFSLFTLNKLNKILNIFVPEKRPQDNVKLTLDEPAEEEQPLSTMTSRSSIHSFYFPENQDYFRKYHLFENIDEKEILKWKKKYLLLLQTIAFYCKKRKLILKNPHNTGRIKELLELFPNAKFIFLHRDPYKVYQSTKKLYMQTISSQYLQFVNQGRIETIILENNRDILSKYIRERKLIPKDKLIEISYSQLEAKPLETIKLIYKKLDIGGLNEALPAIQEYLDSVKNYKKNIFPPLSKRLVKKINSYWDFYFKEWGYEKR